MVRVLSLAFAAVVGVVQAIPQDQLAQFFYSSSGLDLSRSDAEKLATTEYGKLSVGRVSLKNLQDLRNVFYSTSGLDLSKSEMVTKLCPVAEEGVGGVHLQGLVQQFYSSAGPDFSKKEAGQAALSVAPTTASATLVLPMWQALYSTSGLNLGKSEAQRWVKDLVAGGGHAEQLRKSYQEYSRMGSRSEAMKKAIGDSIAMNLNGLQARYAADGYKYTSREFETYYHDSWLTEWLASPLEKRVANDGHEYTVGEFEVYYGGDFANRWNAAPEAPQQRLAADGHRYTLAEFAQYYKATWRTEFKNSAVVADQCAFLDQQACPSMRGCSWQWNGDATSSCVKSNIADTFVV